MMPNPEAASTDLELVRNRWYVILESHEVPSGRPLGVTRLGMPLVLWRDSAGVLRCVSDRCPHRGAALSLGRVVDGCVECPFHGFRFDGAGACTQIPANGTDKPIPSAMRTPASEVREANGFVWLWYGETPSADRPALPDLPWFPEIDDRYVYASFADDWDTHYTRAVENQLDFTHLPFVHATTIGKSVPHRLDVLTTVDGDHIRVTYDPATYDAKGFFVELIAPTLWRNRLSANVWAMIAFVPVDATHTRLYLRFYQSYVTLPGLGWFVSWLSNQFNRHILHQDKRVVLTQEPRQTHLHMGEVLIPSDRPIIEWRRWIKAGASGE